MMTNKLRLLIGFVTLSTFAMAGEKTYSVVLPEAAKAGSVALTAGTYKLKVEGSNAVFTGEHARESVTVPVKVENTETKYNVTAVDTMQQGDGRQITAIELGGSKIKLEFGQ